MQQRMAQAYTQTLSQAEAESGSTRSIPVIYPPSANEYAETPLKQKTPVPPIVGRNSYRYAETPNVSKQKSKGQR